MTRRKISSTRWIHRHITDPYVIKAKQKGYRSRAAFKLIEIDDRFHFLKPQLQVVDLGAAPGSWSQVTVQRVGVHQSKTYVLAVDIVPIKPIPGTTILTANILDPETRSRIVSIVNGKADIILSDMSTSTIGHRSTDHLRLMELAHAAFEIVCTILVPEGIFLCKIFQGASQSDLLTSLKRRFCSVRHVKPASSRKQNSEVYLLATGFR